jgi:hypothetical protein
MYIFNIIGIIICFLIVFVMYAIIFICLVPLFVLDFIIEMIVLGCNYIGNWFLHK